MQEQTAWCDETNGYITGAVHLSENNNHKDDWVTLCGKRVVSYWVGRPVGLFFKHNKLRKEDLICELCLELSGGKGPRK